MGVACGGVGPADYATQDSARGVRGEADGEVSYEVLSSLNLIERFHVVEADEFVVDEITSRLQMIDGEGRGDQVLRKQFEHLFVVGQGLSVDVMGVAEFCERLPGGADLARTEVCDRNIDHVVTGSAITKYRDVVTGSQYAFFDWFRGLIVGHQTLDCLDAIG